MKKNLYPILSILIFTASAALCVLLCIYSVDKFGGQVKKTPLILISIAAVLLSFFTVPLVHELGHLLFGLCANMAFYSIKIGFIVVYRRGKGVRIRLSGGASAHAGSCEMVPKSANRLYGRFMLMVLGGLCFTLLLIAAAVTCFFAAKSLAVFLLVVMTAPVAVYLFFINILPGTSGGADTDGGIFLGLLSKDSLSMATINILAIQSRYFMGKSPKQVEKALYFELPDIPKDSLIYIMLLNLRYIYYLDSGDTKNLLAVSGEMQSLCENLDARLKHNILSDVLYNWCRYGGGDCEKLHEEVQKYLMLENNSTNLRIRAAYAYYCEKNFAKTRQLINRGLDESKRGLISGIEVMETRLLSEMKRELLAAIEEDEKRAKREQINATRIF